MIEPMLRIAGDSAVLVEFPSVMNHENALKIKSLHEWLNGKAQFGVKECVPGYCTLLVLYDATLFSYLDMVAFIKEGLGQSQVSSSSHERRLWLPVCYTEDLGPDLQDVAAYNHVTVNEVIQLHIEPEYFVFFTGFLPSFPFLGGMSKKISTPRLSMPRQLVHGGSVGIAGDQTGIYPLDSPGGWRLIGRMPILLFDKRRDDPFVIHAGDTIRFYSVMHEEYDELVMRSSHEPIDIRIEEIAAESRGNVV